LPLLSCTPCGGYTAAEIAAALWQKNLGIFIWWGLTMVSSLGASIGLRLGFSQALVTVIAADLLAFQIIDSGLGLLVVCFLRLMIIVPLSIFKNV
jgi:hypothetical protein